MHMAPTLLRRPKIMQAFVLYMFSNRFRIDYLRNHYLHSIF